MDEEEAVAKKDRTAKVLFHILCSLVQVIADV